MTAKNIGSKGIFLISVLLSAIVSLAAFADTSARSGLSDVHLGQNAFNPSNGQTVDLSYTLARLTQVKIMSTGTDSIETH